MQAASGVANTVSELDGEQNPLKVYFYGQHERPVYKWVHYLDIYHRHFARFRNKPMTLLEIGVHKGGSLDMWRDYFGAEARIVGLDINPACKQFERPRTHVRIGDQADVTFLNAVASEFGPFDIIVDDGGHAPNQQIVSFETLYPRMSERGVYLVEDTHTNLWPNFASNDPNAQNFLTVSALKAFELMGWTGQSDKFRYFHTPREERTAPVPASEFCKTTHSVAFYDSIVVYEKAPIQEPLVIER